MLEDPRTAAEIEYEARRVSFPGSEEESPLQKRMSYAGPLPVIPKKKANDWKRRTAPVGMGMGMGLGMGGMHTPPLSPKAPARRAGSPAMIGASMLGAGHGQGQGHAGPTPPPSTSGSPTPFSNRPASVRLTSTPRFGRSTPPPVSSPLSSPSSSPNGTRTRPWEKRLSGLSAPERSDSLESTVSAASAASSISTYSYDVQVVRAARVSTHEGVLASPVLAKAASLKSRPSSLSHSATLSLTPADDEDEDSFLAYLHDGDSSPPSPPGPPAPSEPAVEIIKPAPKPDPKREMLWLIENISGHQFYVTDVDVIAVSEEEHRRLRAQETRHFWPVYGSQIEFLSLRRRDIRRRHRATLKLEAGTDARGRKDSHALLVEFTDRFEFTEAHEPPLPGQHEAALSAAFRALRKAEGLSAEDVVLSESGELVTLRSAEQIAGLVRGGWFECDEEFWEDARASQS